MRRVTIDNPRLENTYITDIASDYSSGTAVTVRNNNSFVGNDLGVFGHGGEELTELKKISSISSSTTLTIASSLNFAHNKGTPVYKTLWDFISIEADYGSGFSVITTSGIQWDSVNKQTIYFDPNGTSTTSYRFRFYNSVTTLFSEYSPTLTGAGFTKYQMGYIIREARRVSGDKEGKILNIDECIRSLTRAKNAVRAHNSRYWFWRVDGWNTGITITATAANAVYTFANISQFGVLDYIEYRYTSGATDEKWIIERKPDPEFLSYTKNLNRPNNNFPRMYRLLPPDSNSTKGYFEIENKIKDNGVGIFYISHYKEEPDYDSVDDATALFIPQIYIDYLTSEIYRTKGNEAEADKYMMLFTGPENRQKTLAIEKLNGLALLDELDRQNKTSQRQPMQLIRFRGQKAVSRLFGNKNLQNSDQLRQDYFDVGEGLSNG